MFKGRVFIVGSGLSLTGFDFSRLNGEDVIAVNHAYLLTPHKLHVFYDKSFLDEANKDKKIYDPYKHTSKVLCGRNTNLKASDNVILFRKAPAITKEIRHGLYVGNSSTQAAINAALIFGATEVYLLGIDCCFLSEKEVREAARKNGNPQAADEVLNGEKWAHHVTQNRVKHTMNTIDKDKKYLGHAGQYNKFSPFPVYNCSEFSKLTLPFRDISAVLKKGRTKWQKQHG